MAKLNANGNIVGMIGRQLVFRRVGNETIVQVAPSRTRTPNKAQQELWGHFRKGAQYSKAQLANPVTKAAYALSMKHRTAYHAALADFLNPPQITGIDCTDYAGRLGDCIRICAIDDFRVTMLQVKIITANGTQLENGNATLTPNGLEWIYTTTMANAHLKDCWIVFRAYDMPGNETTKEIILS